VGELEQPQKYMTAVFCWRVFCCCVSVFYKAGEAGECPARAKGGALSKRLLVLRQQQRLKGFGWVCVLVF